MYKLLIKLIKWIKKIYENWILNIINRKKSKHILLLSLNRSEYFNAFNPLMLDDIKYFNAAFNEKRELNSKGQ